RYSKTCSSGDPIAPASTSQTSTIFSFTAPAPTELYTLSLHDALPISPEKVHVIYAGVDLARFDPGKTDRDRVRREWGVGPEETRSEEHTSELQSRFDLVCRLLLEKKKKQNTHASSRPTPAES